jgi:hypothetical protein
MRNALPCFGLLGLLGLSGCVAYPADAYYAQPAYVAPAPVYVAPPALYFGGSIGPSYRGHRGHGGHRGPRHWR